MKLTRKHLRKIINEEMEKNILSEFGGGGLEGVLQGLEDAMEEVYNHYSETAETEAEEISGDTLSPGEEKETAGMQTIKAIQGAMNAFIEELELKDLQPREGSL